MIDRIAWSVFAALLLSACFQGNIFSLEVGDCLDKPDVVGEIDKVDLRDCNESHGYEVYAVFDVSLAAYNDAAVTSQAESGCLSHFAPYVGRSYETSALWVEYLTPTEGSWSNGDREVVCMLYEPDSVLTGSQRDSRR